MYMYSTNVPVPNENLITCGVPVQQVTLSLPENKNIFFVQVRSTENKKSYSVATVKYKEFDVPCIEPLGHVSTRWQTIFNYFV